MILSTALCQAMPGDGLVAALNFELPGDGSIPEWIELIPAGNPLTGRDGRSWPNPDPDAVVARTRAMARDVPVDVEHATELKAPQGDHAPAIAWVKQLEVRDGSIWAQVDWLEHGLYLLTSRSYRYFSPVFKFRRDTGEISHITSVGLTNQPNLFISALNRQQSNPEESTVKEFFKALCIALGLGAELNHEKKEDQDKALTALNQMKSDLGTARNSVNNPPLDKFVPRADHDSALQSAVNRYQQAEQKLAEIETSGLNEKIETAINAALSAGKITPATVEYHTAQCRQEGGLDRFNKYLEAAPVIAEPSNMDQRQPGSGSDTALNAEQEKIAGMFGNSAEDLKKYG